MKTLKMVVELTYDDEIMHGKDPEAIEWFTTEVLGDEELILHSNELGDSVGFIKMVEIL